MRHLRKILATCSVLLTLPTMVAAQTTTEEINRIIRGLDPAQITQNNVQINGRQSLKIVIRNQQEQLLIDYGHSVNFSVLFKLNSALLTPEGALVLDGLSQALKSAPIQNFRYLIAGHTDASGAASYNYRLSLRRAKAVRDYLVNVQGIDPNRFVTFGWGETRLKHPARPFDAANRRVEISLIAERVETIPAGVDVYLQTANEGPKLLVSPTSDGGVELTIETETPPPSIKRTARPSVVVVPSGGAAPQAPARSSALSADECADRLAKDPRPEKHNLDDFDTGRTPLPCEEQKNTPESENELKINF